MIKKFTLIFTIFIILGNFSYSSIFLGTTGKIAGKVTDATTNEAIVGANILIQGTSYGAATNINGEFVILNVPPGIYTLKCSYIGYREHIIENIRVSVDLTTEVNFALKESVIEKDVVRVVAERPLINKNITNSTRVTKSEDIQNLPVRDVNSIVSTSAGVVSQGGNLYVRGSRSDAVAFVVDGVLVTNPLFGGNNTQIINNAIEEIQFQAGGYTAEYGGANAGIISTQLRTGTEKYNFAFEGITDNFIFGNDIYDRKFLGGYSYGYSEYVLTAGGPIIPGETKYKFFVAVSNDFLRSPARFWDGANFTNIFDPSRGTRADTINYINPAGVLVNQARTNNKIQGNFTADFNPVILKLSGTYFQYSGRDGVSLSNFLAANRAGLNEGYSATANLKITHLLAANFFYDLQLNYYSSFDVDMDPDFKHNISAYGDSIENAKLGYTLQFDGQNLAAYQMYGSSITRPGSQLMGYYKYRTGFLGGRFNLVYQVGKTHELKTGGEYSYYTIRRYSFGSAFSLSNYIRTNPDGVPEQWYRRVDNYGYDLYGNKTEGTGLYAPKHPVFAAFYLQDKMEFSDLVINAGIRYDYIKTDSKNFKNPASIQFDANGIVKESELVDVEPTTEISPRLGFSFPVTDQTVFHAQYGKFVQQTRLRDIYLGWVNSSDNIKGGYAISAPVGFGLKPEKTTTYEIGFRQQLGQNFAFDITGFYKDIKDQVQIRYTYATQGAAHGSYYTWVNGDFSTTKGFELKLDLRRSERIQATVDYTYSDARGTGSNPSTAFRTIWQAPTATPFFPQNVSPLDFNQTHRGAINIDYRFGVNDGPSWIEQTGLNLLFTFNSGHNFTKVDGYGNGRIPQEELNASSTPWQFQLDARVDKSFVIGPIKANIYLLVINLLNTKNVVDVFIQTGSTNDGYLETEEGKTRVESYRSSYGDKYAQNYTDMYNAFNINNANIYGTPRQIRLGLKLEY